METGPTTSEEAPRHGATQHEGILHEGILQEATQQATMQHGAIRHGATQPEAEHGDGRQAWTPAEFKEALLAKGSRYHIHHPFHRALTAGRCNREQMQAWVANRYYYQLMLPQKDAAIIANCTDPAIRAAWLPRVAYGDGAHGDDGSLQAWLYLAEASGLQRAEVVSCERVLPGVRFAVDAYVNFARHAPWQEAICSSLTELFASSIHQERLRDWPARYPWLDERALTYFRERVISLPGEVEVGLQVTQDYFRDRPAQERALTILDFKLDVLWCLLDTVMLKHAPELVRPSSLAGGYKRLRLRQGYRLQWEEAQSSWVLLYPEGMVELNGAAAEVLRLCTGEFSLGGMIDQLKGAFPNTAIAGDIEGFLVEAQQRRWVVSDE